MSGGKKTDQCSGKLPSEQKYEALGKEKNCIANHGDQTKNGNIVNNLMGTMDLWLSNKDDARQIVEAYCHASTEAVSDSTDYYDSCHFFYFWLGDLLKDKFKITNLDLNSVMDPVYKRLEDFQFRSGMQKRNCKNLYPLIGKSIFDLYKIIFDYSYNFNTLQASSDQGQKEHLCKDECTEYVAAAERAYEKVKGNCNEPNANSDPWCKDFTGAYKNHFETNGKPKLPCTITSKGHRDESECRENSLSDLGDLSGPLTKDHLGKLPSKMIYKELRDGEDKDKCDKELMESTETQLKSALNGYACDEICREKIISAWCLVTRGMGDRCDLQEKERYDFFYLWLVEQLFAEKGQIDSFCGLVKEIKKALTEMYAGQDCDILCTDKMDKNFFSNAKEVYDYYKDHAGIMQQVGSGGRLCNQEYKNHLKSIVSACEAVNTYCKNGQYNSTPYCSWFNGESDGKNYCDQTELAKLTCTTPSGSSGHSSSVSGSSSGGGSGGVGGMVGGGLASVALPAVGLLLYKYTDVFDGIKKSLFGGLNNGNNRRGRRSTFRHNEQHFDGFDSSTLGDDSSTLGGDGSTTLGGGGGESSTLGGSSTDISTIYDDGERRRRPSPASTKPYNTRQSRNIRYGRI
ncbi:KIR protein [Plasmodium knowlesi strain H]|uniref:KIR protein n=3 Tax=Plasmodium knowlesi TaxID=5850 RepID=A0A5K1VRU0_PLAKH|nr:KIR protein [Plasmodium knowlesi strain H]OTN68390.1 KIR protein [Plasmodium knowlesi]CAA9987183.1 KIR protein [Plasmodium knowlesi strain H]SBO23944.1 KIR protein [Plasmodium knowlesi strain H]SBO25871.1 KIR protein [Plasmodium knowlesi strain H]VVS76657.1 KIR protein [Plasmodium knowlesi strain H]|eukprot:XP_002261804.1 kir protein [Plasmodium knowlesi strain H]